MNSSALSLAHQTAPLAAFPTTHVGSNSVSVFDKIVEDNLNRLKSNLEDRQHKVRYVVAGHKVQSISIELIKERIAYVRYANGDLCQLNTLDSSITKIANLDRDLTWVKFSEDDILVLQKSGKLTFTTVHQTKVISSLNVAGINKSQDLLVLLDSNIFYLEKDKIMQFNLQTDECKIFFVVPSCFKGKINKIETDGLNFLIRSIDNQLLIVDKTDFTRTFQLDNVLDYKVYSYSKNPLFLFVSVDSTVHVFESKSYEQFSLKNFKADLNKVHYDSISDYICVLYTAARAQTATRVGSYSHHRGGVIRGAYKEWKVSFEHQFMRFDRKFELVETSPIYKVDAKQTEYPSAYRQESFEIGDSFENKEIPVYLSDSCSFEPSTHLVSLCALEIFGNYYFCHRAKLDGQKEENIIFLKQDQTLLKILSHPSNKKTWFHNGTYFKIDTNIRISRLFSNSVYVANLTQSV